MYDAGMIQATRYRMYVDESGDDVMDPAKWRSPESRYLGLTGVIIASETYRTRTHREFGALKQDFFPHDPDEPLILVRHQIIRTQLGFWPLKDPGVADLWETGIIQFFNTHVSGVITAVLDKDAYRISGMPDGHPYSYCVNVLTERYARWLERIGGIGDVLIESRGKRADRRLKGDFQGFMNNRADLSAISSRRIKLKTKESNIAGLQLADLFGYPSVRGILRESVPGLSRPPTRATLRFIDAVRAKYIPNGKVLLP